jgi:tetratricopeptide (TPR) repeat protein
MQKILLSLSAAIVTSFILITSCENIKVDSQEAIIVDTVDSTLISFNDKIKKNPNDPELYLSRAKYLLTERNDPEAALADMKRVFLFDSTKADYHFVISDVYFALNKFSKVKESLNMCVDLDPYHVDGRMKLAEMELYLKNYKEVLNNLDFLLKKDMFNAKAYFIKGMAFKETGDTAKAISSFQTTVEQDPDYYHAYMQLGLLHYEKRNKLALDYFTNALKIQPKSIEALYGGAMFCQDNGMYEKAKEAYFNILDIDPAYKNAHYNLGYIHSEYLNDFKSAVMHFSNAVQFAPDYYEAWYMRGYAYERMKEFSKAQSDYRKSLEINPDYTLAAKGLSRVGG